MDLNNANLSDLDLHHAYLSHVGLSGANLSCADLSGVDLRTVTYPTQGQIYEAVGDERTRLPNDLRRPANWS